MALPAKLIGPVISSITGLITSTSMSFVGLALNYGFHPDFAARWLKAAATSYVLVVPMLVIVSVSRMPMYNETSLDSYSLHSTCPPLLSFRTKWTRTSFLKYR